MSLGERCCGFNRTVLVLATSRCCCGHLSPSPLPSTAVSPLLPPTLQPHPQFVAAVTTSTFDVFLLQLLMHTCVTSVGSNNKKPHLISSRLSRSLADRWGTTLDFTTSFIQSSRFSTFRSMMFHSRPVVFPSFLLSASSSPSLNCSL